MLSVTLLTAPISLTDLLSIKFSLFKYITGLYLLNGPLPVGKALER